MTTLSWCGTLSWRRSSAWSSRSTGNGCSAEGEGALLGGLLGLKEGPIFIFSVGLAHYAVLLVTLYQRLPTTETLPKEHHPVFFLFAVVPTVAGMAWTKIHDSFDCVSRIPYFLGLFLNASLASQLRSLP